MEMGEGDNQNHLVRSTISINNAVWKFRYQASPRPRGHQLIGGWESGDSIERALNFETKPFPQPGLLRLVVSHGIVQLFLS